MKKLKFVIILFLLVFIPAICVIYFTFPISSTSYQIWKLKKYLNSFQSVEKIDKVISQNDFYLNVDIFLTMQNGLCIEIYGLKEINNKYIYSTIAIENFYINNFQIFKTTQPFLLGLEKNGRRLDYLLLNYAALFEELCSAS